MPSLQPGSTFKALCLLVCSLLCTFSLAAGQAGRSVHLSAFAAVPLPPAQPACRISIEGESVAPRSASPVRPDRHLLVIVDPGSFARDQAEVRLMALVESIAERMPSGQPVRLGIALLDGILRDPVADPAALRKEAANVIRGYIPERAEFTGIGPGRFFDIVANLIGRAQEEHGDLDCIILSNNRLVEDEEPDYLLDALERRLLSICLRHGSTVYGHMAGPGMWSRLCPATGGELFGASAAPAAVMDRISRNREVGARISFLIPETGASAGRLPLTVECETSPGQTVRLRSVESLWRGIDEENPPDYLQVRQALDWRRRSREAEADKSLTVALRFLESSLREDSWNGDTYFQAGRIAAALGDTDGAAQFLAKAIRFSPADAEAVALFASVGEKLGRSDSALQILLALRDDGKTSGRAIRRARARLFAALDRGREARALYSELLRESPDDNGLQGEYGRVLWSLGERLLAAEQFEAAHARNPENLHALVGLSEVALAKLDLELAAAWAKRALQTAPQQADALFQFGKVELAAQNQASALKSLQSAWETAPQRHDILSALVDAEIASDRFEEARQTLLEAQAAYPASPQVYEKLSEMETHLGNIGLGAAVLEAGAALSSHRPLDLYREAAELRERRGEYGQALLNYRAMLRVADPAEAATLEKTYGKHLDYLAILLDGGRESTDPKTDRHEKPERQGLDVRQPPAPRIDDRKSAGGLMVPGGTALLARTAGLDPRQLGGPQGAERLFHYILESMPLVGRRVRDDSLRSDLLSYMKEYRALIRFLEKRKLIPAARQGPVNLVVPLVATKSELSATKRFLSFFGVNYKMRTHKDGRMEVMLTLKQGRRHSERQRLLRNLGVNLLDSRIHEIRLTINDEELFMHTAAAVWIERILAKPGLAPEDLLAHMIANATAMKLYVTLAACSEAARAQIVSSSGPRELLARADLLQSFAGFLDFRAGQLSFPGDARAWHRLLVGDNSTDPADLTRALLSRDHGRPLALYSLLAAATKPVQDFLTSPPERLEEFYRTISSSLPQQADRAAHQVWQNASRLMSIVDADGHGLYIDVDPRIGTRLLESWKAAASIVNADPRVLRLELRGFAMLLGTAVTQARPTSFPAAETLEFMKRVRVQNPSLVSHHSIPALSQDPQTAAVYLDLVWNLAPDAELAVRYLEYCRRLAALRQKAWNTDRTRTSQTLFALLGALCQQGTLSQADGRRLLAELLDRLSEDREAAFAINAADFLASRLLPAVAGRAGERSKPEDALLAALAGPPGVLRLSYNGRLFGADPAAHKMGQMKQVLDPQQHTPLDLLLKVYRGLNGLSQSGDDHSAMKAVSDAIGLIRGPEFPPDKKRASESIPAADTASLRRKWAEAAQAGAGLPAKDRQKLARETAEALHVELGVTLLTYFYAFSAAPDNDALAFDPHFVRKHAFQWTESHRGGEWSAAGLREVETVGSLMAGSLSGLGYELSRLETAQTITGYGTKTSGTMLPTMLAGMRSVHRSLRSDRAQEYVALAARLGRKALALAILDEQLRSWSAEQLALRASPGRRERIMNSLAAHDLDSALQLLSPSDLFALGRAYASSPELRDADCPIAQRLRSLQPPPGSEDAEAFREEIDQYGVLLRKRAGLNQVAFASLDSYERLASGMHEGLLSERICDLKFRMAELAYARAIPAPLVEFLGEMALRDIRPDPGEIRTENWMHVLDRISSLSAGHAREWIEELLNRGFLVPLGEEGREKEETP